jgi:S1-C subfamily serine protease
VRKSILVSLLVGSLVLVAWHARAAEASGANVQLVEDSVVKIFATIRRPDPTKPWQKQQPQEATATGVVIAGKHILTNAHVVNYATQIEIQANQSGSKIPATVLAISHGMDLAIITPDDNTFFDTHKPLECVRKLPELKDPVMAYGYPTGGANLSITKGIISRIEFASFNFFTSGLRIQIDAAINPGNSGGPAIIDNKMIGLSFASLVGVGVQNIGYIIPCEEISLFLDDVADGEYTGKPAMYDDLQTLENPALRAYLKAPASVEGIVVHEPYGPDSKLKPWDIITRIGDAKIDNEGMVRIGSNLRIRFQYLIQKTAKNGTVPLTVVRLGKEIAINQPVPTERPALVTDLRGKYPSYFVYGPLVFSNATLQYVGSAGAKVGASLYFGNPLAGRLGDEPAFEGEELVVIVSPFLTHKVARDYSDPSTLVIKSVNGVTVKNLLHLVQLLRDNHDDYVVLDFYQHNAEALVFSRKEMATATEEILTDNGIRAQGSADTLAVWNGKAAASN